MKESDMYAPIKELLEEEGYTVRSEVKDADVVAVRDEEMIIVEMKTSFNLKLVYQLIERQRMSDKVYAAVLVNYKTRWGKSFQNMAKLLKRLSLGLIIIYEKKNGISVEKLFDPDFNRYNKSHVKERRLKYEFEARSGDYNTGGVTKKKIVTSYREKALQIACLLESGGPASIRDIKEKTGVEKAASILQKNHYGWFVRETRGVYKLSDTGVNEISSFENAYNKAKINDTGPL